MNRRALRRLVTTLLMVVLLTIGGAVGFHLFTDSDWVESIYMAVITITTVGYRDPANLTPGGKIFVICYLMTGLGIFTYSLSQLGQWLVSDSVRRVIERRHMTKLISELNGHYIVCGMGRMGFTICTYLEEKGRDFVVIDNDDERLAEICADRDWYHILGDATDDAVLQSAGILSARSLATVLPTDADNIYVVLSARIIASDIKIVARAGHEKSIEKMQHAGANRVISPFSSGAVKMARLMLNPTVEDFLEIAGGNGTELELADIEVTEDSPFIGKQLRETELRAQGVMIIGILRQSGERLMPPTSDSVIQKGDSLFAFGSAVAVQELIHRIE